MKLIDITRELFDYLVAFRRKVAQASAPGLEIVQHEIEMIFHSMEKKIEISPKLINEYRQVKYPLVVLADEIILTSAWSHAKQWEQCLFERRYFSSNIGGNKFFKLLSEVDRMPQSVVTVFFYCLAFGFRGGFAHDDPSLMRLKGRLLQRIEPEKSSDDAVVFEQAYRVEPQGAGKLPRVWKWRHIIILTIVSFITLLSVERLVIWPLIMGRSFETALAGESETSLASASTAEGAEGALESQSSWTAKLGLFSSETLAKHFSKQLELQGVSTKIYYAAGGTGDESRYIVVSGTFKTKDEAMQLIEKARSVSTLVSEMSVLGWDEVTGDCILGCE